MTEELFAALPSLRKAVFSQPIDSAAYSRVTVRPVQLKGRALFQLEGLRDSKAFHENLDGEALLKKAESELDGRYRQILIIGAEGAAQYVLRRDGSYRKSGKSSVPLPGGEAALSHDREKRYLLAEGENIPALVDLGVFTPDMQIVKARFDKYRQINRFIELIDDVYADVAPGKLTALDFGCGKSYLTFLLYYYFAVKRGFDVEMIGYDLKADVVERCNAVARKYGYDGLHFVVADVTKDKLLDKPIDLLVTLHACDTATDYALDFAVRHGAKNIFSVPCCQHEINAQIRKGGDFDLLLRHGLLKERLSALLTDAIRGEVLEDAGYAVDLIEFIDFEHSPKNLMIRARRQSARRSKYAPAIRELCARYGFTQTLLELSGVDGAAPLSPSGPL